MPRIRVRAYCRHISGKVQRIPAHWREIGGASPDVGAIVRDALTMDWVEQAERAELARIIAGMSPAHIGRMLKAAKEMEIS